METIIGFAVGFVIGTRQGREGMERLRASIQEIAGSDEVRALIGQAVALAAPVAQAAIRSARGERDGDVAQALARSAADALKHLQRVRAA